MRKIKLRYLLILILSFCINHFVYSQCTNSSAYGSATAPTSGTVTISTCQYQTEYSTIFSVVAGTTYESDYNLGGCITVHSGSYNGPVVAFGPAPLQWTATVAGNHYVHYNDDCGCTTSTGCGTSTITFISSGGGGGPCSSITTITGCGSGNTQTFSESGSSSWMSTSACGFSTPGIEHIYEFTASTTGTYNIQVTSASGGYVDYMWKASSGGCNNTGWTCIDDVISAGTYGSMSWTAGVTYYILLDPEGTGAYSNQFYINCPATGPCSTITTIAGCGSGNTQTYIESGSSSWMSTSTCGYSTPGTEHIYEFTAPTTGTYSLQVTSASGGYVDYMWKASSGGCTNSGWSCIGDIIGTGSFGAMSWTAGVTYYILLDPEGTGSYNHQFYINCPATGPCSSIITIADCGVSNIQTFNVSGSSSWMSSSTCGYTTPGVERIYQFTPTVTGTYTLEVTNTTGGYVDYMWKLASGGCNNTGWTCISDIMSTGSYGSFSWTAGVTYYILLDPEGTGAYNHQFYLSCPSTEMVVPSVGSNSYTVCSGNLYDNGGSTGNYSISWSGFTVLYPDVAGNMIEIFGNTAGESCCDYLYIYNGVGIGGTLLWSGVAGFGAVPLQVSTDPTGALTVRFTSDGSVVGAGFDLTINCFVPCGIASGTASASPTFVTACSNTTLTLVGHAGTIQWQASSDGVTWSDIPGATTTPYVATVGGTTYYRAAVTSGCTSYSNTVTVTVGGAGNNYYVNDGSIAGDIYCTAIGNAGNSGTVPCSPKASIQDIIDSYDLNAGDTIFIDAGTYTMGCNIGSADGGSAANDVVIIGAGTTSTFISAPVGDDNFYLVNVQYIRIENMRLISLEPVNFNYVIEEGTQNHLNNCHLVHLANTNIYMVSNGGVLDIDENTISNCTIENSSSNKYNIWIDGDADNDTIRDCNIISTGTGGAKAIYLTDRSFGLSDMWPTRIHIFDNVITSDDYGFYANTILGWTMEAFNIHDNIINITSKNMADGAGLYLNDHGLSSFDVSNIYRNRINGGKNGIYLTNGVDYCHFYNNYIYGSDIGINVSDNASDDNDLTHNSFYTAQQCAYFNLDSKGSWYVRNNIFYTYGNSAYECLYAGNATSTFITCDYNIYWAPNGANIAEYFGAKATYSTLAAWQAVYHHDTGGNGDANSFEIDPTYQAPGTGNLDVVLNYQTGVSVGTVTSDIYLTGRTHPTIGAFEEGSVLPVDYMYYKAKCMENSILINWTTASENNVDYFEVERTYDLKEWQSIGEVNGAGNSNQINDYRLYDYEIIFNSSIYYRIKEVDLDNKIYFSSILNAFCDDIIDNEDIVVISNSDNFEIVFKYYNDNEFKVYLIDYSGRLVYSNSETINQSKNKIVIPKNYISPGLYSIVLQSSNNVISKQVVVQH